MIVIRMNEGRSCPMAICDTCGQRIEEAGMAAVVWDREEDGDRTFHLAHKGRCHDRQDKWITEAGGSPGWSEFDQWAVNLLHNSGLQGRTLARAAERAADMDGLGL